MTDMTAPDRSTAPRQRRTRPNPGSPDRPLALQRFQTLFAYHPQGVWALDLEGHFTDANGSGEKLSGYSLEELRGMHFTEVVHPEDLPLAGEVFEAALHLQPRVTELRMVHRSGRVRDLRIAVMPIVVEGRAVGVHGTSEDITEDKQVRRDLEQAQQAAEDANAAKTLFLANVSHELRTPLTALIATNELLDDHVDAAGADLLATAQRSGDRLQRMVDDLLDFSRLESSTMEVLTGRFAVRELVGDATRNAELLAGEKGLILSATVDPRVPAEVLGDQVRMGQVLDNLLRNAVKFTHEGHVALTVDLCDLHRDADVPSATTVLDVDLPPGEVRLEFVVTDTGIGMQIGSLDGLFSAFTQADPSTTRTYGGAGLGLAICADMARLLGGSIEVTSRPGIGSRFVFTVPVTTATQPDPSA